MACAALLGTPVLSVAAAPRRTSARTAPPVAAPTRSRASLALSLSARSHNTARPLAVRAAAARGARRAPATVVAMAEAGKDKTVLVVGATGYIGRFVTKVGPMRAYASNGDVDMAGKGWIQCLGILSWGARHPFDRRRRMYVGVTSLLPAGLEISG